MSQTIADVQPRSIHRWNQVALTWVQVILPSWTRRVSVRFATNAGFISHSITTDGDAFVTAIADLAEDVDAGDLYSVPMTAGRGIFPQKLLFVRVSAATDVTVVAEENERG